MQNKAKVNMVKMDKIEPALSLCPRYEPVLSVAEGVEWVKIGNQEKLRYGNIQRYQTKNRV